jgi:hypothetical protein
MYFSPNSAGEQPGIRATYIALHGRRFPNASVPRNAPNALDDALLARVALHRVGTGLVDRPSARAYARVLAANPATRLEGLLSLATVAMADSGLHAADGALREAAALDADAALEQRALFALVPGAAVTADTLRVIRASLSARRVTARAPNDVLSSVERDDVRQYLIGLLSVRLNDARGVLSAQGALQRRAAAPSRVAAPLRAAVAAHWALRRGQPAEAAAEFEHAELDLPVRVRAAHPALEQHVDRWARAEVLSRLGRKDEAVRWYQSVREGFGVGGMPFYAAAVEGAVSNGGRR